MAQRKLFLAQSAPVQLGRSAAGCYSSEVLVWKKPLALRSNMWHASVAELNQEEKARVAADSLVFDVATPLWFDSLRRAYRLFRYLVVDADIDGLDVQGGSTFFFLPCLLVRCRVCASC